MKLNMSYNNVKCWNFRGKDFVNLKITNQISLCEIVEILILAINVTLVCMGCGANQLLNNWSQIFNLYYRIPCVESVVTLLDWRCLGKFSFTSYSFLERGYFIKKHFFIAAVKLDDVVVISYNSSTVARSVFRG